MNIIQTEGISDVLIIFLKIDSISENFSDDPQMTQRRYVLVNYTPSQKKKIKAILHTHSYNFSEPFADKHRKGLFVKENRDAHEIARLIGINYKMQICPLTEVHVMYLNPSKEEEWLYYQ